MKLSAPCGRPNANATARSAIIPRRSIRWSASIREGSRLHLCFMLPSYPWTRALEEGRVKIPGMTYECAPYIENAPDRFDAFTAGGYDVGEDGVRRFAIQRLKGAPPTALPVFFDRELLQR